MSGAVETCPKEVWNGWNHRTCGRPVKRLGLCGLHASAIERAQRKEADRIAARGERATNSAALVDRLARHGISARVRYDGALTLPDAHALADELDAHYPNGGAS